jgi:hypothetical protein
MDMHAVALPHKEVYLKYLTYPPISELAEVP